MAIKRDAIVLNAGNNNRASMGSNASRLSSARSQRSAGAGSFSSRRSTTSKRRTMSYSTIPMLRDLQMAKAKVVDVNHDRYVTHHYKQKILGQIEKKEQQLVIELNKL